jgi:predicted transcriptional regulator of viral defense system
LTQTRYDTDRVIELARKLRWIRVRDVVAAGIHPEVLRRLYRAGRLAQVSRGLYILPDADVGEGASLAEAALRVPRGILCLLSALRLHDLTTQSPFEVWMAVGPKARAPRADGVQIRIVRMTGPALTEGIEHRTIDAVPVKVFSVAKTVADCFKFRSSVGLDVAMEALREAYRSRRATIDEIWYFAQIDRVASVMRPYLDSLSR